MNIKRSKIRRKAKRQAQREEFARREKYLREIEAPKRRLDAEIAARGKQKYPIQKTAIGRPKIAIFTFSRFVVDESRSRG
jgi:hypothetical protein